MALRVALLFLLFATPAVYAASHVVGGGNGWNTGVDYTTWANGETFNVGDTLDFNYDSSHGVAVVRQNDFNNCNTGNALQSFTGGSTTINLTTAAPMYFICTNSFHCGGGMKLAVNVKAAGNSPPSSSTPTTPSTPSGSTTPSTTPSTSTKSSPNSSNGATTGSFGSSSHLMLGFSLVLVALVIRA